MIWWEFSRSLSRWPFNCVLTETVWISACHRIYHEIAVIMHLCKGKCIKECVKICEIKLLQNEQQIAKINPREILFLPNFVHVMFSTLKGIIYWSHRLSLIFKKNFWPKFWQIRFKFAQIQGFWSIIQVWIIKFLWFCIFQQKNRISNR